MPFPRSRSEAGGGLSTAAFPTNVRAAFKAEDMRWPSRRRIPEAPFAVKKYSLGTIVSSTAEMSDNENSSTPLGNSVVSSVQHSVRETIPAVSQRPEEGTKVPSFVRRQDTIDVFPDDPRGLFFLRDFAERERELPSRVVEAEPLSSETEALAGRSADEDVDLRLTVFLPIDQLCHVSEVRHVRAAVGEHGAGERVDLAQPCRFPPERPPCHGRRLYPATYAAESHSTIVSGIGANLVSYGGSVDELIKGGALPVSTAAAIHADVDRTIDLENLDSRADDPKYWLDDFECLFLAPGENLLDMFNLLGVGLGSYELEGGRGSDPK